MPGSEHVVPRQVYGNQQLSPPALGSASVAAARVEGRNFSITGSITVPSGSTEFIPPFFEPVVAPWTKQLVGIRTVVRTDSVTFDVTQNGNVVIGGITATATAATTTSAVPLADGDALTLVVTATSGAPDGLSVTFLIKES